LRSVRRDMARPQPRTTGVGETFTVHSAR
jgi:hypothetical protein